MKRKCHLHFSGKISAMHLKHRLNMEFIWAPLPQLYSLAETPANPPPPTPAFGLRGRYWSGKIDDISLWPPDLKIFCYFANTGFLSLQIMQKRNFFFIFSVIQKNIREQKYFSKKGLFIMHFLKSSKVSLQFSPAKVAQKMQTFSCMIMHFYPLCVRDPQWKFTPPPPPGNISMRRVLLIRVSGKYVGGNGDVMNF